MTHMSMTFMLQAYSSSTKASILEYDIPEDNLDFGLEKDMKLIVYNQGPA